MTDLMACFGEDCERALDLWDGKESWELGGKFFSSLEDKNVESKDEDGGLVCEVSEGSLKTLLGKSALF